MIEALLEAGAEPNNIDSDGETVLDYAKACGLEKLVKLLKNMEDLQVNK